MFQGDDVLSKPSGTKIDSFWPICLAGCITRPNKSDSFITLHAMIAMIVLQVILVPGMCAPEGTYNDGSNDDRANDTTYDAGISTEIEKADYLVLIVIDGCRPDYLELTFMPNLTALRKNGTYYDSAWVGQLESTTPASLVSISTGLFPKNTGITGFAWIDGNKRRLIMPTMYKSVKSGDLSLLLEDAGAKNMIDHLRERYPNIVAATFSCDKYYAALALGGSSANYVLFSNGSSQSKGQNLDVLMCGFGTDGPISPISINGSEGLSGQSNLLGQSNQSGQSKNQLNEELLRSHNLTPPYKPGSKNSWTVDLALDVFLRYRPEVIMIDLSETDEVGHKAGPENSTITQLMIEIDVDIGRLLQAYEDAGIFNKTLFVITSDHGMIPGDNVLDTEKLTSSLLLDLSDIRFTSSIPLYTWPYLWLNDQNNSKAVGRSMTAHDGITATYYRINDTSYTIAGDRALSEELNDAYMYLTSTMACKTAPNLVLVTKENTTFKSRIDIKGDSSEVTWGCQHIPLLFCGPGVRNLVSDAPASLVDIAPTVTTLMGAYSPEMDGVVLADALKNPTRDQMDEMEETMAKIRPFRDAIIQESGLNV